MNKNRGAMKLMKTILSIFTLSLMTLLLALNGRAQDFEGIIHYKISNSGNMDYIIKDDKVRIQLNNGPQSIAMILKPKTSMATVLLEQRHLYTEFNLDAISGTVKKGRGPSKKSTLNKTGRTKTIAGHKCEIWEIQEKNGQKFSLCVAKDLGKYLPFGNPMARQDVPAWLKTIGGKNFMPLEVAEMKSGKQTITMKAMDIEKKSLSNDLFEIPPDYKKTVYGSAHFGH